MTSLNRGGSTAPLRSARAVEESEASGENPMKKSGETAGVRNLEESEGKPSTTLKVTTGAMASGVVSMCTLVMFHLVVCRVSPLIFASTFVASVFSGAFAAVESGMGSSNTGNVSESSKKGREAGNADSSN
eukprot:CAMPEP_0201499030 /NCGR_PEP_ID=MMETSP0151_2-20130828/74142_1 /ASSEMBLY_ACC=CAM_ASM_000257 /TAXON_ID=200890 /ORGANISM="Paramoeba atlantica, Strain 621/1 / CCAP 1560/9" /LENGTH=130 /DNA_ID=CAMNT_0047891043 /DNA_START=165 /DNA_END=554 /DNA_ORIENTATION=-